MVLPHFHILSEICIQAANRYGWIIVTVGLLLLACLRKPSDAVIAPANDNLGVSSYLSANLSPPWLLASCLHPEQLILFIGSAHSLNVKLPNWVCTTWIHQGFNFVFCWTWGLLEDTRRISHSHSLQKSSSVRSTCQSSPQGGRNKKKDLWEPRKNEIFWWVMSSVN